jgi:hypothetical protein
MPNKYNHTVSGIITSEPILLEFKYIMKCLNILLNLVYYYSHSVGIVRSRTQTMEFSLLQSFSDSLNMLLSLQQA